MQALRKMEDIQADALYMELRDRFAGEAQAAANQNTHSLHGELLDTLEEMIAAQSSHILTARGLSATDSLLQALNA